MKELELAAAGRERVKCKGSVALSTSLIVSTMRSVLPDCIDH